MKEKSIIEVGESRPAWEALEAYAVASGSGAASVRAWGVTVTRPPRALDGAGVTSCATEPGQRGNRQVNEHQGRWAEGRPRSRQ